jgi:hypothetical protein
MISHSHKFIFIHIPKCGGTTIESSLKRYASDVTGYHASVRAKRLRNKELFDALDTYENYHTFSFIRNPFERILSTYAHFHSIGKVKTNFKTFIFNVSKFLDQDFESLYKQVPYNHTNLKFKLPTLPPFNLLNIHKYPFEDMDANGAGNVGYHCLPQTFFPLSKLDYIGKQENLQNDFNKVCSALNIETIKLPFLNKHKHKHYTEYYDDETREIVAKKYRKDIEYFGYKFGN